MSPTLLSEAEEKSLNNGEVPHEPGVTVTKDAVIDMLSSFPKPPSFEDKYEEREYLKGRLAAALRIFGKLGFEEGVAGHITLRDPVDPQTFVSNLFMIPFAIRGANLTCDISG